MHSLEKLHSLIGFDGSRYAGHSIGVRLETGRGYDASRQSGNETQDWALISLDTKLGLGDRVLPVIGELPEIGSTVMLGDHQHSGYRVPHHLARDRCHGPGFAAAHCTGASGAPLVTEKGGKWHMAGFDVAAEPSVASGSAVVLNEALKHR